MALTKVPAPVLDLRNGDQVTAQAIGALPPELSDRSDSNPAVVILEAGGTFFDKLIYQLNQWPSAVVQKLLSLVGVNLIPASPGSTTQQFTLSAPQQSDTVIPRGSTVSTNDGTLIYSTLSDLTIRAYATPAGTITLTSGSTAVVGSGTTFTSDAPAGYQVSTDGITWYTVSSVTDATHLTLTSSATSTVSASAYKSGPVTGSVSVQATTSGLATNAAANTLTTVVNAGSAVASTTNAAAAVNGADQETVAAVIARAPQALSAGGTASTASDYAYFAAQILGLGGRAVAQANTNNTTSASGYTTVGLLSPAWTTSSSVSAQDRANVVRDLSGRTYSGATTIDVAANIQQFVTAGSGSTAGTMFACALYRKSAYDETSTIVAAAGAINTYLSPNTYPWGRSIDPADLVGQLEVLTQVDRVATINGRVAVGMDYTVVANNVTFTAGSTSVTGTAGDFTNMTAGQTFLMDATNKAVYLVTNISSGTLTITPSYAGPSSAFKPGWFTSKTTTLTNWYTLPFSLLSVLTTSPPASIVIVGAV